MLYGADWGGLLFHTRTNATIGSGRRAGPGAHRGRRPTAHDHPTAAAVEARRRHDAVVAGRPVGTVGPDGHRALGHDRRRRTTAARSSTTAPGSGTLTFVPGETSLVPGDQPPVANQFPCRPAGRGTGARPVRSDRRRCRTRRARPSRCAGSCGRCGRSRSSPSSGPRPDADAKTTSSKIHVPESHSCTEPVVVSKRASTLNSPDSEVRGLGRDGEVPVRLGLEPVVDARELGHAVGERVECDRAALDVDPGTGHRARSGRGSGRWRSGGTSRSRRRSSPPSSNAFAKWYVQNGSVSIQRTSATPVARGITAMRSGLSPCQHERGRRCRS